MLQRSWIAQSSMALDGEAAHGRLTGRVPEPPSDYGIDAFSCKPRDGLFRRVQFLSASLYSLGHGGNDAQKTMGTIAALLSAHGQSKGAFHVPYWVVISCNGAMALGTLLGGWRIVRTMGSRITHLTPVQGV